MTEDEKTDHSSDQFQQALDAAWKRQGSRNQVDDDSAALAASMFAVFFYPIFWMQLAMTVTLCELSKKQLARERKRVPIETEKESSLLHS